MQNVSIWRKWCHRQGGSSARHQQGGVSTTRVGGILKGISSNLQPGGLYIWGFPLQHCPAFSSIIASGPPSGRAPWTWAASSSAESHRCGSWWRCTAPEHRPDHERENLTKKSALKWILKTLSPSKKGPKKDSVFYQSHRGNTCIHTKKNVWKYTLYIMYRYIFYTYTHTYKHTYIYMFRYKYIYYIYKLYIWYMYMHICIYNICGNTLTQKKSIIDKGWF